MPFGGGTLRWPQLTGWGNAMRYLLTGDRFSAEEALRIGLVQEVVEPGRQAERAYEIALRIAKQALSRFKPRARQRKSPSSRAVRRRLSICSARRAG